MTVKNNNIVIYLLYISATLIVFLSGYFSVAGISALFAGKKLFASIMAISFQLSKITIVSILSQKWTQLKQAIRTYLLIAAIFLVIISSSGIYSYLADAYQLTLYKSQKTDLKIQNIEYKQSALNLQKQQLTNQIKSLDQQISSMNTASLAFSKTLTQKNVSKISNTQHQNTNAILQLQKQKTSLYTDITKIDSTLSLYNDSKFKESTSQQLKQVGPLKQIGILFNTTLDSVVQFFLFIIILIFDPIGIIFINLLNKLDIIKTKTKEQQFKVEKPDLPLIDIPQIVSYQQEPASTPPSLEESLNIEKDPLPENINIKLISKKKLQKKIQEEVLPEQIIIQQPIPQSDSPRQTIAIY